MHKTIKAIEKAALPVFGQGGFLRAARSAGPGGCKPAKTAGDTPCYEMGTKGGVFAMRCCAPGALGPLGLLPGGILAAGPKGCFAVFC